MNLWKIVNLSKLVSTNFNDFTVYPTLCYTFYCDGGLLKYNTCWWPLSEDQELAINVKKQHKRCVYLYKYIYSSSH